MTQMNNPIPASQVEEQPQAQTVPQEPAMPQQPGTPQEGFVPPAGQVPPIPPYVAPGMPVPPPAPGMPLMQLTGGMKLGWAVAGFLLGPAAILLAWLVNLNSYPEVKSGAIKFSIIGCVVTLAAVTLLFITTCAATFAYMGAWY